MKKKSLLGFWQLSFAILTLCAFQIKATAQIYVTSSTSIDAGTNTLTLDLAVEDFEDILSTQFTLAWNEDVLSYNGVNNFGLPFMTAGDFGTSPDHLLNGMLPFAWFDNEVTGVSAADGTVLFSVQFDVLSNNDPEFAIEDCPTPIEVTNISFNLLDLYYEGTIAGGCDGSGGGGGSNDLSDWVIEFPADVTVEWPATTVDAGTPTVFFDDDELIGISFSDVVFYDVPGFDAKIERTWTAINWIEVTPPITNYIVEVPENQLAAPNDDLNGDGVSNERTFRDSWDGVNFPNTIGADWDGYIQYTQIIWVDGGTGDPCDVDDVAPTPFCISGLTVLLEDTTPPSVEVWAIDFDAGSFDNCSDELIYSFSSNPNNQSMVVTDANLGNQTVEIWMTDEVGNQSFCSPILYVVDEVPTGSLSISGFIADPYNNPIEGAIVTCSYGNLLFNGTTDNNGFYEVTDLPAGETYTVTVEKPSNDYASGVTTYDVAKLRCIILALEQPQIHQMLASDVNASLGATTFDMVLMNKLILGLNDDFSIPVWQFVSDFGSTDPWNIQNVSQEIIVDNLTENAINQNFTAVKAGNLVPETNPNPTYQPSFDLIETASGNPDQVQIDLTVENFENFTSAQFALEWNASVLGYESYELVADPPAGNTIWTDANIAADGNLRVLIQDPAMVGTLSLDDGETLLRFTFNILQLGNTEVAFVDDAIFPKIVTVNGCDLAGGVFNFTNAPVNLIGTATTEASKLDWDAQLLPNLIAANSEVSLEITGNLKHNYTQQLFNSTGQLMWSTMENGQSNVFQNKFMAPQAPGIYYLQIIDNQGRSKTLNFLVL